VAKSKQLRDSVYREEVERLSGLPKYPALPRAQQELCAALRRISETDGNFLHRLINDVVDTHTTCPTPADLIQMAGAKRSRAAQTAHQSMAIPDCEICGGSGFVSATRLVKVSGLAPYEAEFAAPCNCRGK